MWGIFIELAPIAINFAFGITGVLAWIVMANSQHDIDGADYTINFDGIDDPDNLNFHIYDEYEAGHFIDQSSDYIESYITDLFF